MPAFSLSKWKQWTLAGLPEPGQPFGLSFSNTAVTNKGMQQLINFKQLRWIDFGSAKVTDEQISALAGQKQLQALSVAGTEVTDTGCNRPDPANSSMIPVLAW